MLTWFNWSDLIRSFATNYDGFTFLNYVNKGQSPMRRATEVFHGSLELIWLHLSYGRCLSGAPIWNFILSSSTCNLTSVSNNVLYNKLDWLKEKCAQPILFAFFLVGKWCKLKKRISYLSLSLRCLTTNSAYVKMGNLTNEHPSAWFGKDQTEIVYSSVLAHSVDSIHLIDKA